MVYQLPRATLLALGAAILLPPAVVLMIPAGMDFRPGAWLTTGVAGLVLIISGALWLRYRRRQRVVTMLAAYRADPGKGQRHGPPCPAENGARLSGQKSAGPTEAARLVNGQRRLVAWDDGLAELDNKEPRSVPMTPASRVQDTAAPTSYWASTETPAHAALQHRLDSNPRPAAERYPLPAGSLSALCAEELRNRLPLLLQAMIAGDTASARMESHAMRGVAANFGLVALAEMLLMVEVTAKAQRIDELLILARTLPPGVDAALEALLCRAA